MRNSEKSKRPLPLRAIVTRDCKNRYNQRIQLKELHQRLAAKGKRYVIKNRQFTLTCYYTQLERVMLVHYHPRKGTQIFYTNLDTHNKRVIFISPYGKVQSDHKSVQKKTPVRGRRKSAWVYLDDFYDMHVEMFLQEDFNIDTYFKNVLAAPEIEWWDEQIGLTDKTNQLSPQVWWQRGKEKVRIAKEPTGIYISLYADTLELLESERFDYQQ